MVKEFHELIGAPVASRPMIPHDDRVLLRLELIREELNELVDALAVCRVCERWHPNVRPGMPDSWGDIPMDNSCSVFGDITEAADALGDLLVVVYGAGLEFGIDLEPVFNEIHRSNMTKGGGEVRVDGKVLKGPNYQPPALGPIIACQSARDEWDDYPEARLSELDVEPSGAGET